MANTIADLALDKINAELRGDASRAATFVKIGEIEDAVFNAYHKASTLLALSSPTRATGDGNPQGTRKVPARRYRHACLCNVRGPLSGTQECSLRRSTSAL
jgi:hypothetical protein